MDIETVIEFAKSKNITKIIFTHIHPDLEKIKQNYLDQSDSYLSILQMMGTVLRFK